jgi:N-acetylglucosamine kinase-like BadF-type ATPase
MTKLFLFESGSTKTTLLVRSIRTGLQNSEEIQQINLSGYNPNRNSLAFIEELKKLDNPPSADDEVCFYGSGLASSERKDELKAVFRAQFQIEIAVFDDILGAARALFKKESGVFAIMGTGGVVGYYNGNSIEARRGGYGYLIDDLGGGYELGKKVVSAWLNGDFPAALQNEIESLFQTNRDSFTSFYYSNPHLGYSPQGLKKVTDTVKLISAYQGNEAVNYLLENYFTEFFKQHIIKLCENKGEKELKICGSLAEIFHESIQKVAANFGLIIKEKLRYPAHNLLEYHLNEISMRN